MRDVWRSGVKISHKLVGICEVPAGDTCCGGQDDGCFDLRDGEQRVRKPGHEADVVGGDGGEGFVGGVVDAAVAEEGRVDDYLERVGCFGGYDGDVPVDCDV